MNMSIHSLCIVPVTCGPLQTFNNGEISYSTSIIGGGYPVGTVASLECRLGYNLSVSDTNTCVQSSTHGNVERYASWNQPTIPATCNQGNYNYFDNTRYI